MKKLGIIIALLGFSLLCMQNATISSHTHVAWVKESNSLGDHKVLTHDEASAAVRRVSLRFNQMFRSTLVPGSIMLAGTVLIAFGKSNCRKCTILVSEGQE